MSVLSKPPMRAAAESLLDASILLLLDAIESHCGVFKPTRSGGMRVANSQAVPSDLMARLRILLSRHRDRVVCLITTRLEESELVRSKEELRQKRLAELQAAEKQYEKDLEEKRYQWGFGNGFN